MRILKLLIKCILNLCIILINVFQNMLYFSVSNFIAAQHDISPFKSSEKPSWELKLSIQFSIFNFKVERLQEGTYSS